MGKGQRPRGRGRGSQQSKPDESVKSDGLSLETGMQRFSDGSFGRLIQTEKPISLLELVQPFTIGQTYCTCPRCFGENEVPPCDNCGWRQWRWSPKPGEFWTCDKCQSPSSKRLSVPCVHCGDCDLRMHFFAPRPEDWLVFGCRQCSFIDVIGPCSLPAPNGLTTFGDSVYQACGAVDYELRCKPDMETLQIKLLLRCNCCETDHPGDLPTACKRCGAEFLAEDLRLEPDERAVYVGGREQIAEIRRQRQEEATRHQQEKVQQQQQQHWDYETDARAKEQKTRIEAERQRLDAIRKFQ